jgi:hypothetical protein
MREVLLGRTHVRHRADHVILHLERGTQPFGLRAYAFVAGEECGHEDPQAGERRPPDGCD